MSGPDEDEPCIEMVDGSFGCDGVSSPGGALTSRVSMIVLPSCVRYWTNRFGAC